MTDPATFTGFVRRIRAGDERAAAELVRQYEPFIRREVRLRLLDRRLCRVFDSMDVCQSVLASFFVRAAAGEYDLQSPEHLLRLLVSMARNQLVSAARRQSRQRRDHRRLAGAANLHQMQAKQSSPSQQVAGKELRERFRQVLSNEERQIAELRSQGLDWSAIAGQLGGTPQARRMQLARALERATQALGLEEAVHA